MTPSGTLERDTFKSPSGSFHHKSIYDNVSSPVDKEGDMSHDMSRELNGDNQSDEEGGSYQSIFVRLLDLLNC